MNEKCSFFFSLLGAFPSVEEVPSITVFSLTSPTYPSLLRPEAGSVCVCTGVYAFATWTREHGIPHPTSFNLTPSPALRDGDVSLDRQRATDRDDGCVGTRPPRENEVGFISYEKEQSCTRKGESKIAWKEPAGITA